MNGAPTTGIVWTREVGQVNDGDTMDETASFIVNIGDTIGIFMGMYTRVDLLEEGFSQTDLTMGLELQTGQPVPALVEYSYAPGLVYDPDQNITFLKDWSAFASAMNWSDANDMAENFTYVSGGITYSDWRLPNTIDQQGAAGELGYLSTHYSINETFWGPFTNVTGEDYWTSPRFGTEPDLLAYMYTFSTTYGPGQWLSETWFECHVAPVFDGPPREYWCPADFNSDGIVDLQDFATFASYWLSERP